MWSVAEQPSTGGSRTLQAPSHGRATARSSYAPGARPSKLNRSFSPRCVQTSPSRRRVRTVTAPSMYPPRSLDRVSAVTTSSPPVGFAPWSPDRVSAPQPVASRRTAASAARLRSEPFMRGVWHPCEPPWRSCVTKAADPALGRRFGDTAPREPSWSGPTSSAVRSADRRADQLGDALLHRGTPLHQRVGHRPHVTLVEVGGVLEAERGVAVLELARVLEEHHGLAVGVRIGGHPVPGLRQQVRRRLGDRHVDALGERTVVRAHLRDRIEERLEPLGLLLALLALGAQLRGALLHGGALLGAEAVGRGRVTRLGLALLRRHAFPSGGRAVRRDAG